MKSIVVIICIASAVILGHTAEARSTSTQFACCVQLENGIAENRCNGSYFQTAVSVNRFYCQHTQSGVYGLNRDVAEWYEYPTTYRDLLFVVLLAIIGSVVLPLHLKLRRVIREGNNNEG